MDAETNPPKRGWRAAAVAALVAAAVVTGIAVAAQAGRDDRSPQGGPGPAEGSVPPTSPGAAGREEPTEDPQSGAPPVVLELAGGDVELTPHTYCWRGCVDGVIIDPEELPKAGQPRSVDFWFGTAGADFEVTLSELGVGCPRRHTADAVATGDHTFRIEPAGPAGRYQVDLFGRAPGGRDLAVAFVWTTPVDAPVEPPRGSISLVADDDGELTSYGLEVGASDLAATPATATAEVLVTAANGRSATLATQRQPANAECYEQGSVAFRGSEDDARAVTRLGPAPFTYRVTLTLDGKQHVGTATWPEDEMEGQEPGTALTFTPPLPAYVP